VVPFNRYIAYFSMAGTGCALDLATKHWMFEWLEPGTGRTHWLWEGVFGFQTHFNPGALFGMGQGMWPVFTSLSVAAAVGIVVWLFVLGAAKDWWLTIALSLISGGIFGNLYDRLGLPGIINRTTGETLHAVRDFILMQVNDNCRWPNYNIADSLLVCGAAILFCHAIFVKPVDQEIKGGDAKPATTCVQTTKTVQQGDSQRDRSA